jgi:hypothetical protein
MELVGYGHDSHETERVGRVKTILLWRECRKHKLLLNLGYLHSERY